MRFNDMKKFLITVLIIFAQASFAFIEIDSKAPNFELTDTYAVSYTHLTLPTKRIV